MHPWTETSMLLLILTNLVLLGTSRFTLCIRIVAAQGVLLSLLPLLGAAPAWFSHGVLLALSALALKGIVFPALLLIALREADVQSEVQPFIGFAFSLATALAVLALLLWLGTRLRLPAPSAAALALPAAWFTSFTGLFLIINRKKALSQVLGYLVLENGIYAFGINLLAERPWLVELGILLDVFVAVFVMGIMIFHISREFNHIDTYRLAKLRDWSQGREPADPDWEKGEAS